HLEVPDNWSLCPLRKSREVTVEDRARDYQNSQYGRGDGGVLPVRRQLGFFVIFSSIKGLVRAVGAGGSRVIWEDSGVINRSSGSKEIVRRHQIHRQQGVRVRMSLLNQPGDVGVG